MKERHPSRSAPPRSEVRCGRRPNRRMKGTELQAATVAKFGKDAAQWVGKATNVELREALKTGEAPPRVATPSAVGGDLAALIAASAAPLLAGQLNEERVNEIVDEKLGSYRGAVDGCAQR